MTRTTGKRTQLSCFGVPADWLSYFSVKQINSFLHSYYQSLLRCNCKQSAGGQKDCRQAVTRINTLYTVECKCFNCHQAISVSNRVNMYIVVIVLANPQCSLNWEQSNATVSRQVSSPVSMLLARRLRVFQSPVIIILVKVTDVYMNRIVEYTNSSSPTAASSVGERHQPYSLKVLINKPA